MTEERMSEKCACGRDEMPKPGNVFVHGHNSRRSPVAYVVDDAGCWVWQRSTWRNGYGRLKRDGKWVQAYRVYYERHVGPIPKGLTLDHLCRNRLCVNPTHLEPVTREENLLRAGIPTLTPAERELIARTTGPQQPVADQFGISRSRVSVLRKQFREQGGIQHV